MLSKEDYQKIVNRLMYILGKNINIMDINGIIIASGDEGRIGTLHEGAREAATFKKEVIICDDNKHLYKGSKKGINIPIFNNDEVIGVVGITGEPNEVLGFGKIIKELVELMVQEYENNKFQTFQSRAIENFTKELFKKQAFEKEELSVLKHRAEIVGFNLKTKRYIIVLDIITFNSYINANSLNEFDVQQIKQSIIDDIKLKLSKKDIIYNISEDRFVIITQNENPLDLSRGIQKEIYNKYKLKFNIGIGKECQDVEDYYISFTIANKLIKIGRILNEEILYYKDSLLYLMLDDVPEYIKKLYINELKTNCFDLNKNVELLTTLKVYFETGMNIKETAARLYVHTNTIKYRLDKIEKMCNVNIKDPFECMKIYFYIALKQISSS
ncbi:MAG: transcriptional regulator, CdaR [Caloramator sp.]|jgi:carbohydrate diacid regulator|uniref:CdaR family transcriptional regulator n=1 Tax=Caloramator sp. TaxID=1871330 RepID=UPI001D7C0A55|nr:sugar diacid recognition domain-containing protein [Caloramator sp.]MBZ4662710.1 transcriptional regulator, CdaR [Caloramator sp.]